MSLGTFLCCSLQIYVVLHLLLLAAALDGMDAQISYPASGIRADIAIVSVQQLEASDQDI